MRLDFAALRPALFNRLARFLCRLLSVAIAPSVIAALATVSLAAATAPSATPARVPWTGSHIEGTPEPPKAFVGDEVFSALTFNDAVEFTSVPDSDTWLVLERRGRLLRFAGPPSGAGAPDAAEEILNLRTLQPKLDNAFGVVLHPRFRETRQIFVSYALTEGIADGSRVSRFTLSSLDPLRIDPASEQVIITWLAGGHNGCNLRFGPDGFLYVSTGDGGPAAPPDLYRTGQDPRDLLSSILRLDVDHADGGKNYRVPPDNPWAAGDPTQVRPELWAFGLRNPWKISFDPATGNLWCGDVGWELWEMIHLIRRGGNYGWSAFEGNQPIHPETANPLAPISKPIVAHNHSEAASITAGFVYHGKQFPELAGAFLYGDWVTGKIWALWYDGQQVTRHEEIADTPHAIIAFAADRDGEPYYAHYGSKTHLYRVVRNPHAATATTFPRQLSATGLFADVARQQPAPGVYPFTISAPKWDDGAVATRFIGLRERSALTTTVKIKRDEKNNETKAEYATTWPKNAVLARTITRGALARTPAERTKPIETQVLHYDGESWAAYSYRWNDAGTDADLVPAEGADVTLSVAADPSASGPRERALTWRFSSRAECLRCHSTWHNGALAFTAPQLRGAGPEQTARLIDAALVDGNFFEQTRAIAEPSTGPAATARGVLHVNCAPCHSANAGGAVTAYLNQELLAGQMNLIDQPPARGTLGLTDAKLIAPGDPWHSVLVLRLAKTGSGHMPPIGSHTVDVAGLKTIEDWIARLPAAPGTSTPPPPATWDKAAITSALGSVAGALQLARAVDDGQLHARTREQAFQRAWASPEASIRDVFDRFKPDALREATLGATIDAAAILRLAGEPSRGAQLVASTGKLAACQACHVLQGEGRHVGPDLSRIGAQQSAAQILDSIVTPSKTIAPLYRPTVVELRDGSSQMGFIRARGANELVLALPSGATLKVPLADIKAEKTLLTSLMPEGLLQGLTPQEAADLVAYLASLK